MSNKDTRLDKKVIVKIIDSYLPQVKELAGKEMIIESIEEKSGMYNLIGSSLHWVEEDLIFLKEEKNSNN